MRRAKIVCTLGPASSDADRLLEMINAGMDIARFNMSHGSYPEHEERLRNLRDAEAKADRPIGLLADLQGPKIRLGTFGGDGSAVLDDGQEFTVTTLDVVGDKNHVGCTHKGLPHDVKPGDQILVDDGKILMVAKRVTETDVVCEVIVGGPVSNHKGFNLPGASVSVPAMSEKDADDLRWALRNGFDMVALSFVRDAADVDLVRQVMTEEGRTVPVIAKLEKPQAIENLDDIIDAFDAFMVARGDLGVELPLEEVPLVQKQIITKARRWAKPVIVATQMLESMIGNPRPTRAEASDVANAILDGADAVMLSGETSVGKYPVETVGTMAKIVDSTEVHGMEQISSIDWDPHTTGGVISKSAVDVAERVGAAYLVAFTQSGDTARRMARLRPRIPIVAFSPLVKTQRELTLSWGIRTVLTPTVEATDDMVRLVDRTLKEKGVVQDGERVVIVAGTPAGRPGRTNSLRVHKIGSV
ncbi:pyruvate kinase [Raineyella fluvialis]|uniref:Pyruvate kinase n=1 Tax=Raineyella fluvialis TaxID=2662261 RepID=A0A5Q2FGK1_9ACTN|nr:pyruvate kinase [Raineyella fluvialis]QGF24243.1 pyruvate kinase [Raineyella fluvialis]